MLDTKATASQNQINFESKILSTYVWSSDKIVDPLTYFSRIFGGKLLPQSVLRSCSQWPRENIWLPYPWKYKKGHKFVHKRERKKCKGNLEVMTWAQWLYISWNQFLNPQSNRFFQHIKIYWDISFHLKLLPQHCVVYRDYCSDSDKFALRVCFESFISCSSKTLSIDKVSIKSALWGGLWKVSLESNINPAGWSY